MTDSLQKKVNGAVERAILAGEKARVDGNMEAYLFYRDLANKIKTWAEFATTPRENAPSVVDTTLFE